MWSMSEFFSCLWKKIGSQTKSHFICRKCRNGYFTVCDSDIPDMANVVLVCQQHNQKLIKTLCKCGKHFMSYEGKTKVCDECETREPMEYAHEYEHVVCPDCDYAKGIHVPIARDWDSPKTVCICEKHKMYLIEKICMCGNVYMDYPEYNFPCRTCIAIDRE